MISQIEMPAKTSKAMLKSRMEQNLTRMRVDLDVPVDKFSLRSDRWHGISRLDRYRGSSASQPVTLQLVAYCRR